MDSKAIKEIITKNESDIAFIVGNGIHRYSQNGNTNHASWDELLLDLYNRYSDTQLDKIPSGISYPEFYDMIDFKYKSNKKSNENEEIKEFISNKLIEYSLNYISPMVDFCKDKNIPILTTNFDKSISEHIGNNLFKLNTSFSDYYPWSSYFGEQELKDPNPTSGFGIWHINGFINYKRSIKLGLSDYMGCVQRARKMIHGKEGLYHEEKFEGKHQNNWPGYKTWLHIIFNKSLFIFGLGLEENETFLRWLLIERKKYYLKNTEIQEYNGWYICCKDKDGNGISEGKKFFLQNVGIKVIEADDYKTIYEDIWYRLKY